MEITTLACMSPTTSQSLEEKINDKLIPGDLSLSEVEFHDGMTYIPEENRETCRQQFVVTNLALLECPCFAEGHTQMRPLSSTSVLQSGCWWLCRPGHYAKC